MKKIEILSIKNFSNFWIAQLKSSEFINTIHNYIEQEPNLALDDLDLTGQQTCSVFNQTNRKWYRALIIQQTNSFGQTPYLRCFLVDTAQIINVPNSNCKRISNQNLKKIPHLAQNSALYGIKPLNGEEWPSSCAQLFYDKIKLYSNEVYCEIVKKTMSQTTSKITRHVKIYFKTTNNNLICFNDFLVESKIATHRSNYTDSKITSLNLNFNLADKNFDDVGTILAILNTREKIKNLKTQEEDKKSESSSHSILKTNQSNSVFKEAIQLDKLDKDKAQVISQKQIDFGPLSDVFLHNASVNPIRKITDCRLHQSVQDFLNLNHFNLINEFNSYFWASVLRGLHVFGLTETKDKQTESSYLSLICPLLSSMLEKRDILNRKKSLVQESGYIKDSMAQSQAQNGPILLIVCSSCESAQRIYESINQILELNSNLTRQPSLKALLIQGGGLEYQYDVPLANGVDILIAATPFCLLKALGSSKTNLERLFYFAFDNLYTLLEKFPIQIKALMDHYKNLFNINDKQQTAQMVVLSNYWSLKIKSFLNMFLNRPAIISTNKLETSYLSRTHHILKMCFKQTEKYDCLENILMYNSLNKNTIVLTKNSEKCTKLYQYLKSREFDLKFELDYLIYPSNPTKEKQIEDKWSSNSNRNLLLILDQNYIEHLNISSSNCIINFDFPHSKSAYAKRLWLMRKNFSFSNLKSSNPEPLNRSTPINESITCELNQDFVLNEQNRLCSYLFVSKSSKDFSNSFYNYLIRIGYKQIDFPESFIRLAEECRLEKENLKKHEPLCPYLKTFGTCMNISPTNCVYRHIPYQNLDLPNYLDEDFKIPIEGYIKFKIAFVKDTNNFYINLISHLSLDKQNEVIYDKYSKFDLELQHHFSDPRNIKYASKISDDNLFVFKDMTTSIFKRIKILDVKKKDGKIAYELIVNCIDYGCNLKISSKDLIKLPDKFKALPAQAVEVYLCNIRPIDKDVNWSVPSKVFLSEKLSKSKEFVGKIQLCAGSILWLDPITSFKHLKSLDLLVCEDSVRNELIEHNYGVNYPNHLKELRNLFTSHGLYVPRLEDDLFKLKKESLNLFELFYDMEIGNEQDFTPDFAFLKKDCQNEVYLLSVESLGQFYLQLKETYNLKENLKKDFKCFLNKLESFKNKKYEIEDLDQEDKKYLDLNYKIELLRKSLNKTKFDYLVNKLNKNLYCLVKYKDQDEINRAKIIDILDDEKKVKVFYVDYGDYGLAEFDNVYPISSKFIKLLPFQAIQCSIDYIQPYGEKWSKQVCEQFLNLTQDKTGIYEELFAQVEQKTDFKYSIKLFKKFYPKNIDLGLKLVSMKQAQLNSEINLITSFSSSDTELSKNSFNPLLCLSRQFINIFIKNSDKLKQDEFLNLLDYRSAFLSQMNKKELIELGLIQTLAKNLFFITDKHQFIKVLKYLKKNFLKTNPNKEDFKLIFFQNFGIDNLIETLYESEDVELKDYLLFYLNEFLESAEIKLILSESEAHIKSIWLLIEKFKSSSIYLTKCLNMINLILDSARSEQIYSKRLINFIRYVLDELKTELHLDEYKQFENAYFKFKSKQEKYLSKYEEKDDDDDDDNEKENSLSNQLVKEYLIKNQNFLNNQDYEDEDLNSSYEEIYDQFCDDIINLFVNKPKEIDYSKTSNDLLPNEANNERDYMYPKIIWNQIKQDVVLKVKLKNIRSTDLKYSNNFISFRCFQEKIKYGFDFNLYSEIDVNQVETTQEQDCFKIVLKKKIHATWIRLLSVINKPKYIISEFDNINSSDSENEEKIQEKKRQKEHKEFVEYLEKCNMNKSTKPNTLKIDLDDQMSSTTTDSESDFEDFNTDLKETKDYMWD